MNSSSRWKDIQRRSVKHSGGIEEFYLSVPVTPGKGLEDAAGDAFGAVEKLEAEVVHVEAFGPECSGRSGCLDDSEWPVTRLLPVDAPGKGLGGIQVHALRGCRMNRLRSGNRVTGSIFEIGGIRYCRLGGIFSDPTKSRPEQAREVFEVMVDSLSEVGMEPTDIVRTWLYLDEILDWYDDFNKVRTGFFREHGIFNAVVPASTGIGGPNPAGAAVQVGALAIRGDGVEVCPLPSPLQNPALDYGSSFSRAVAVSTPDSPEQVLVSGTASINSAGKTVHTGEIKTQISWTMEVVTALLGARGFDWKAVSRATAYVLKPEYAEVFRRFLADKGSPAFPLIIANDTICRDDLLFEIEVDALHEASGG